MTPGKRRGLMAVALAGTLLAMFLLRDDDSTNISPAGPQVRQRVSSGSAPAPVRTREKFSSAAADLFAPRNWRPPPPMPEATSVASAPTAPALPYVYTGRMEEGGGTVLFLSRQQHVLLARQGETLDGLYRVDRITPWGVEFTYLPLKQKQTLNFSQ